MEEKDTQQNTQPSAESTPEETTHTTPTTPEQSAPLGTEPAQQPEPKSNSTLILVIVVAAIALIALYFFMGRDSANDTALETDPSSQTAASLLSNLPDGPVARINGEEISAENYSEAVTQLAESVSTQGGDLNDTAVQDEIKDQALTRLINNVLLRQEAESEDITASEEEVQAEVDRLETQLGGAEAFAARMDEIGLTMEELREDISDQIVIGTYVQDAVNLDDISVSAEEVSTFYERITANATEAPALEEVEAQIREQLKAQKQQEEVLALLESLRDAADVEILI